MCGFPEVAMHVRGSRGREEESERSGVSWSWRDETRMMRPTPGDGDPLCNPSCVLTRRAATEGGRCISYRSAAVRKHPNESNLSKKGVPWAYYSRGKEFNMMGKTRQW